MLKALINLKDIICINKHAPNKLASKYVKQTYRIMKRCKNLAT